MNNYQSCEKMQELTAIKGSVTCFADVRLGAGTLLSTANLTVLSGECVTLIISTPALANR